MGRTGSAVAALRDGKIPGYERRKRGSCFLPPGLQVKAGELYGYWRRVTGPREDTLRETTWIIAYLVADETGERRRATTRALSARAPYSPVPSNPALVRLGTIDVFRPRTAATRPLTVWHELATPFCSGTGGVGPRNARRSYRSRLGCVARGSAPLGALCGREEPVVTVSAFVTGGSGGSSRFRIAAHTPPARARFRGRFLQFIPRSLGRGRDSRRGAGKECSQALRSGRT